MENNKANQLITSFISKYETKIEVIFGLLSTLSVLLYMLGIDEVKPFIGLSLSTLGLFYFLFAFSAPKESQSSTITNISFKVTNIASSVAVIGIMYKFLNLPGSTNMIYIGVPALIIAGAVYLLTGISSWDKAKTRLVIRILLITSFALLEVNGI